MILAPVPLPLHNKKERWRKRKMIWVRERARWGAAWARDGGGCVRGAGARSVRDCVNFKDGGVGGAGVVNFSGGSTSARARGERAVELLSICS